MAGFKGGKGKGKGGPVQSYGGQQATQDPVQMLARALQMVAGGAGAEGQQQMQHGVQQGAEGAQQQEQTSAYDQWAKEKEREAQRERDQYVERQLDRRSCIDARQGRVKFWFPESAMVAVQDQGGAGSQVRVKTRKATYGQISVDWGGVHGAYTEEELLTAGNSLTDENVKCRILSWAVPPQVAHATAEDEACLLAIAGPGEHTPMIQEILGRYDWGFLEDHRQVKLFESLLEAVMNKMGVYRYRTVGDAMMRARLPKQEEDIQAKIEREVQRRIEEMMETMKGTKTKTPVTTPAGKTTKTCSMKSTPTEKSKMAEGKAALVMDLPDTVDESLQDLCNDTHRGPFMFTGTHPADYQAADMKEEDEGAASDATMGPAEPENEQDATANEFVSRMHEALAQSQQPTQPSKTAAGSMFRGGFSLPPVCERDTVWLCGRSRGRSSRHPKMAEADGQDHGHASSVEWPLQEERRGSWPRQKTRYAIDSEKGGGEDPEEEEGKRARRARARRRRG